MNNLNKKALLAVLLLTAAKPASAGLLSGLGNGFSYAGKGIVKGLGFMGTKAVRHPFLAAAVAVSTLGSALAYRKFFSANKPADIYVTKIGKNGKIESGREHFQRRSIFSRLNVISPLWSWIKTLRSAPAYDPDSLMYSVD